MSNKQVKFEWYVLNGDFGDITEEKFSSFPYSRSHAVKPWNIFNNCVVYADTVKLCKDFKKKSMSLEEFTDELRKIIMHEEWSRVEYEIMVGAILGSNEKMQKIDCYYQVLPNIEILAKYVLNTYYPRLKI